MKQSIEKYCWRAKPRRVALPVFVLTTLTAMIVLIAPVLGPSFSVATAATVAEVNQRPITNRAVNDSLKAYLSRIGHQELPASRMQSLREEILKHLIEEELLYQEGLKTGLSATEDEIDAGVAKIRNRFQSDQSYEAAIQKQSLKREEIRAGVKRSLIINKTWGRLSNLPQAERSMRLKAMSEGADIQVNIGAVSPISQKDHFRHKSR